MISPDDTEAGEEQLSRAIAVAASRTAERRALYRESYMAALGGVCADTNVANPVKDAHALALETVRQWDAMMVEVEEG